MIPSNFFIAMQTSIVRAEEQRRKFHVSRGKSSYKQRSAPMRSTSFAFLSFLFCFGRMSVSRVSKSLTAAQQWRRQDSIVDCLLPRFYEYDMMTDECRACPTEMSTAQRGEDSELAMDDGADAMYAETLLNCEFFRWLYGEEKSLSSDSLPSLDRLRMLVNHIGRSSRLAPPSLTMIPTNHSLQPSSSSSAPSLSMSNISYVDSRSKGKKKAPFL